MIDAGNTQVDEDALVFVGFDDRRAELENVAVPADRHDGGLAVTHAMPTRYKK